ncbi:MAG TPA: radical SAM protein [Vicinamibacteria bacterium]|nr:radical SAM protein [Vicinamibacteria bacterium]
MRRRARLLKAYLKGSPIWCSLQITRRCDSFCAFCEHRNEGQDSDMDLDTCRRVADGLSQLGSLVISLSGGDPFLHGELPAAVAIFAREHFPLLTTNGWLVTADRAREVWKAGLQGASVLLFDADPERHDDQAGFPGSHARALAALDALARERTRPGQRVNVKARFRRGDAERLGALAGLAQAHGATLTVEPAYPLSAQQPGPEVAELLLDLRRRHPAVRSGVSFLAHMDRALTGGIAGCRAGRAFLNVDHRGRASKCIEFQQPEDHAGDLGREDVREVVARLRKIQETNACRACWSSARGEVESLYGIKGFVAALPHLVRP